MSSHVRSLPLLLDSLEHPCGEPGPGLIWLRTLCREADSEVFGPSAARDGLSLLAWLARRVARGDRAESSLRVLREVWPEVARRGLPPDPVGSNGFSDRQAAALAFLVRDPASLVKLYRRVPSLRLDTSDLFEAAAPFVRWTGTSGTTLCHTLNNVVAAAVFSVTREGASRRPVQLLECERLLLPSAKQWGRPDVGGHTPWRRVLTGWANLLGTLDLSLDDGVVAGALREWVFSPECPVPLDTAGPAVILAALAADPRRVPPFQDDVLASPILAQAQAQAWTNCASVFAAWANRAMAEHAPAGPLSLDSDAWAWARERLSENGGAWAHWAAAWEQRRLAHAWEEIGPRAGRPRM